MGSTQSTWGLINIFNNIRKSTHFEILKKYRQNLKVTINDEKKERQNIIYEALV